MTTKVMRFSFAQRIGAELLQGPVIQVTTINHMLVLFGNTTKVFVGVCRTSTLPFLVTVWLKIIVGAPALERYVTVANCGNLMIMWSEASPSSLS